MGSVKTKGRLMNPIKCRRHIEPVSNRLKKLTEANRSLAEIESLDDLLLRLMDLAKEVTAAEASILFLHHSEAICWKSFPSRTIDLETKQMSSSRVRRVYWWVKE